MALPDVKQPVEGPGRARRALRLLGLGFACAGVAAAAMNGLRGEPSPEHPHRFAGVMVPESPVSRHDAALHPVGAERLLQAMDLILRERALTLDGRATPPERCTDDRCRVLGLLSAEVEPPLREARERLAYALRMRLALAAGQGLPGPLEAFAAEHEALYLWARRGVAHPPGPTERGVRERLLAREAPAVHAAWVLSLALVLGGGLLLLATRQPGGSVRSRGGGRVPS